MKITRDVAEIASILNQKHRNIAAYPTETFYGLGSRIDDSEGLEKIVTLKGRDSSKGMIVLIPDMESAQLIAEMDEQQKRFLERFWPGPLSAMLHAKQSLAPILSPGGKVALRISPHPLAISLTKYAGPITSTSANPSGIPPATTPQEITAWHLDIDAILDGGQTPGGKPSTLIDITVWPPALLREGIISFSSISNIASEVS